MNWLDLLKQIFEVCIIPLLGILTTYIVQYIRIKKEEMKTQTENEKVNKYLDILAKVIEDCVVATNQTYVETLKKEGKFDIEAQKQAFLMTSQAVFAIMSDESLDILALAVDDLNEYIRQKIEAEVNKHK